MLPILNKAKIVTMIWSDLTYKRFSPLQSLIELLEPAVELHTMSEALQDLLQVWWIKLKDTSCWLFELSLEFHYIVVNTVLL